MPALIDGQTRNRLLRVALKIGWFVFLAGRTRSYVRAAILSDQQSDFVYVVNADNKAERRNVKLGQSTPTTAAIESGLKAGDLVIVEGLQRVRPGIVVQASPATPGPQAASQ